MVATELERIAHAEIESSIQTSRDQQQPAGENITVRSIGRQLSIYSLTLDEFQNTLSENGKSFGSMNMDEFLNSIWTAEENHGHVQGNNAMETTGNTAYPLLQFPPPRVEGNVAGNNKGITKQPSIPRQGSFSIPEPLCRKTVDEVWSEIQKDRQQLVNGSSQDRVQNPTSTTQKQPTFGEMTLEDFLVRAGVVREQNFGPAASVSQYGMYQNSSNPVMPPNFIATRPLMAVVGASAGAGAGAGAVTVPTPFQTVAPSAVGGGAAPSYPGGMKIGDAYTTQKPSGMSYGARIGNGSGGFGQAQGLGIGSPASPVTEGLGTNSQVEDSQYGLDSSGMRAAMKRIVDGPVEKVVERRQRRMIKNRESAARSRARKQAYTVELEAELNQLREENTQLKQALAESERKRKQQYYDEMRARAQMKTKAGKARERLRTMRRSSSCVY